MNTNAVQSLSNKNDRIQPVSIINSYNDSNCEIACQIITHCNFLTSHSRATGFDL